MRCTCRFRQMRSAATLSFLLGYQAILPGAGRDQESSETSKDEIETKDSSDDAGKSRDSGIQDAALTRIGEFKIGTGKHTSSVSLAQIVNPFEVRKRGRIYGSIYAFHRNDNFDARIFFDPVGQPLPEFKRNQFGISFGTFLSNQLSVFGTYEGLRINRGSTRLSLIPTPEMKRGDFGKVSKPILDPFTGVPFQDNRIPASRLHPVALRMLSTIPVPNRDDPGRNFVNNQPEVLNTDSMTLRVDYLFRKDSHLFANYGYTRTDGVEVHDLPAFGRTEEGRNHDFSLSHVHTFGPRLVVSHRLQVTRNAGLALSVNAGRPGLLASLGIAGVQTLDALDEGYPEFQLFGYPSLGLQFDGSPRTSFRNSFGFSETVTLVHGNHQLALGGQLYFQQLNNVRSGGLRRGRFVFDGSLTGDSFADFLIGLPTSAERGVGSDRADLRRRYWNIYLRDDWKINPRFNLSLSLAYNRYPFYRSVHDNISTRSPQSSSGALIGFLDVGSPLLCQLHLRSAHGSR